MATRWSPDTCDCVLVVAPDWASAVFEKRCKAHEAAKDDQTRFLAVHNENAFKNVVVNSLGEKAVSFVYDDSGLTVLVSKDSDVVAEQAKVDQDFGGGSVKIVKL